jgi:hypothetical protein
MAISADPVPRGATRATITFALPPADGQKAVNYVEDPPAGEPKRNLIADPREILINDIRGHESSFTLDQDAFAVVSGLPRSAEESFSDDESIEKNYYPEVAQLLLDRIQGSTRVFIFDHTIRRTAPGSKRVPVLSAHIDQTALSAEQRVRTHLGPDAEVLLQSRYRIVNVWRTLNKAPLVANPLAFASSASFRAEDAIPVEQRYPSGYTGQYAAVAYSEDQRWYYWSGITGDERLMLECFDSERAMEGRGKKRGQVPHAAFVDPRTRLDAEARESVEVRALVFGP